MNKEMKIFKINKKAQFYLIATIIIVGVIIGFAGMTNYVMTEEAPIKFYDLGEEISEEGYRTSEYMIINQETLTEDVGGILIEEISKYIEPEVDNFAVLSGNQEKAVLTYYTKNDQGDVKLTIGDTEQSFIINGDKNFEPVEEEIEEGIGGNVAINILGQDYNFNLKKGENFVFILTKNQEQEQYIIRSKK